MRRIYWSILRGLLSLVVLNVAGLVGTVGVITVTVYLIHPGTRDMPFWHAVACVHMICLVGLMFLVPVYAVAYWRLPVSRGLWVPALLGLLWVPGQCVNPIPLYGWRGLASMALTTAAVALVVLAPAVFICSRGTGHSQ